MNTHTRAEIERRREELAAQVAELHWDLGGLVYEMATRDHFRNDVLLRRAAQLQELDTELAEVERELGDERARGDGSGDRSEIGRRASKAWAGVLPSAQVSALLLVAFIGFGAAVGAVAKGARARRRSAPARVVLVAQAPPVEKVAPTTPSKSSPPSSQPEATPAPASAAGEPAAAVGGATKTAANTSAPAAGKTGTKPSSGTTSGSSGGGEGAAGGAGGEAGSGGGSTKLPRVKHVFVVMLDDEPYATAFGPASPAHYLAGTLEHKGELLVRYYAVAHEQLANGIALLSGQGPTPQTAQNCPTYTDLTPGTSGAEGQASGQGCVYPSATQTLAGQLTAKHLTWRAYVEGMDEGGAPRTGATGAGASGACAHPALGAAGGGAPIPSPTPPAGQTYATWRNPFMYFHSVTDSAACASDDVGLSKLKSDLASAKSTPSFAYIVPDLCHDGNATPCAPGQGAGMGAADGFLRKLVPEILGSQAYKQNGLLAITVDEAPSSGEYADSSSCCGQPSFPNLPPPAGAIGPPGGGQVGALLLSPFIKGGGVDQDQYNHFSLLRTVESFFGLPHLGYAAGTEVSSFSPSLFSVSK
jgi:phosphatidylinositol-3-phosphatase